MVFEKIRKILSKQRGVDENKITEKTKITEDFGADPLDLIELVMTAEAEFEIEIPNAAMRRFKTVGDVVKYVEEQYK